MAIIVLRTLVVYAFVLGAFRLSGKREVGQLAPFDFALILLIANSVQNAMVGPSTSLVGGLVAAAVLILANLLLGKAASRSRKVERLLRGQARILVNRGHVYESSLHTESISHEELLQALRENGCSRRCPNADWPSWRWTAPSPSSLTSRSRVGAGAPISGRRRRPQGLGERVGAAPAGGRGDS